MKRALIVALVGISIYGCTDKSKSISLHNRTTPSALEIQVVRLEASKKDELTIKYGVRIYPAKEILDAITEEEKQALWYSSDSCFYLKSGDKKFYASFTEPVANGQKGNFEYLVMFDVVRELNLQDLSLAFDDKYLSHKTHLIKLNTQ